MQIRKPNPESQQHNLMKVSPRLINAHSVNGMVTLNVPEAFYMFAAQLLNTLGQRSDYFATCITCHHWNAQCQLYNQMPPPEVIANGCDQYQDRDYIPF
jgi:hypothetical protein